MSYLRCESAARRPRVWAIRRSVSNVSELDIAIGSGRSDPGDEPLHLRRELEPAVQDDAGQRRERARARARAVRRPAHPRGPRGRRRSPPSVSRGQNVLHRHRCDDDAERLALEQCRVAPQQARIRRLEQRADALARPAADPRGSPRPEHPSPALNGCRDRVVDRVRGRVGSARLTTTASSPACCSRSSAVVSSATWRISSGVRAPSPSLVRPPSTRSTGAPRLAAMRAL